MSSNSPGQVQLWLVRVLLVQFLKWWKWAMNVRSYVFLKMLLFLKILSLVLNLMTQIADLLLRSGEKGPYCSLWRRTIVTSFPALSGEDFVAESEVCGVVSRPHLPSFHDQEGLIYFSILLIYYSILCNRI